MKFGTINWACMQVFTFSEKPYCNNGTAYRYCNYFGLDPFIVRVKRK